MLVRRVVFLVGRCNRTAVGIMLAKLGEPNVVKHGRAGELGSSNRQQQRLHDQGVDRSRADQPSPEPAQPCASLIWSGWHAHKRIAMQGYGTQSGSGFGGDSGECRRTLARSIMVKINVATLGHNVLCGSANEKKNWQTWNIS